MNSRSLLTLLVCFTLCQVITANYYSFSKGDSANYSLYEIDENTGVISILHTYGSVTGQASIMGSVQTQMIYIATVQTKNYSVIDFFDVKQKQIVNSVTIDYPTNCYMCFSEATKTLFYIGNNKIAYSVSPQGVVTEIRIDGWWNTNCMTYDELGIVVYSGGEPDSSVLFCFYYDGRACQILNSGLDLEEPWFIHNGYANTPQYIKWLDTAYTVTIDSNLYLNMTQIGDDLQFYYGVFNGRKNSVVGANILRTSPNEYMEFNVATKILTSLNVTNALSVPPQVWL